MLGDDPPYLSVGTEVSAKYKGAFCEAKIRKVVRSVKCRVTYKQGLGTSTVTDEQIKGTLRVGASVEARHSERKEYVEATITKIQDCSQYTVVFDDGDITTLRRTALCLKSGRHFAESETLDQLPLTHPEHFGNPVIGGRRGRRSRQAQDDSSDEDDDDGQRGSNDSGSLSGGKEGQETEPEIGRVVCVELGDKKKKDNWFPGLVVAPTAQDTVKIRVRDDYLVRSFKDARYYTVPKKEATEFTKDLLNKVESTALKVAVEKAILYLEKNELPPHWDRDSLFGTAVSTDNSDSDADLDSDSSDDEPREEKDHFVAQLYKFMDDRGTPINNCPMIGNEDIDLYRLFRAVYKLGGYNRVTNQNQWKLITRRLNFSMQNNATTHNLVKQAYKKFLHSFEDFYRKLGCTMVNHPRGGIRKPRPGRSLIRDKDRNTPVPTQDKTVVKTEREEDDKDKRNNVINDEDIKKEKREIKKEPPVKEEDVKPKRKEEPVEESASGQESDVNIDGEEESSSSEKSLKNSRLTPSSGIGSKKSTAKNKEDTTIKKKSPAATAAAAAASAAATVTAAAAIAASAPDKKKTEPKKQEKKDEKIKEEDNTKTRSRSKEDTKGAKPNSEVRETRTPSRETDKKGMINKQRRMTEEELKKRGRKKKESENEKSKGPEEPRSVEYAPTYKGPVEIGDRLKVYYGPTHESKVTYEAKVIDMEKDGTEAVYLVHYTGWNTRYDEWIKAARIAHNYTQAQGRVKRTKATPRPQTPSANTSAAIAKSSKTQTAPNSGNNASLAGAQSRRRAQSVAPTGKDSQETGPLTRATTPSPLTSSALRTKSPATNSRPTRTTRTADSSSSSTANDLSRRTRRTSGMVAAEESESEESDSMESDVSEQAPIQSRSRKNTSGVQERSRREARRRAESRMKIEDISDGDTEKEAEEPRRGRRLRKPVNKIEEIKSEPESEEEQPKGRDFDLNQIRSELKGFDKAVKLEIASATSEQDEESEKSNPQVKQEKVETDNVADKKIISDPEKKREILKPEPLAITTPIKRDAIKVETRQSDNTEDIYEFKEPEPFEFEVRNKRDSGSGGGPMEKDKEKDKDKVKKRAVDDDLKSPKKRQKTFNSTTPSKAEHQKTESNPLADTDIKKKVRKIFKKSEELEEADAEGEDSQYLHYALNAYKRGIGANMREEAFDDAIAEGAGEDKSKKMNSEDDNKTSKKRQPKTFSAAAKSSEAKPELSTNEVVDSKKKPRKVFGKKPDDDEDEESDKSNKDLSKFFQNYSKPTYDSSLTDKAKKDEDTAKTVVKKRQSKTFLDSAETKKKPGRKAANKKPEEDSSESASDEADEPAPPKDLIKYFSHYSGPKAKAAAAAALMSESEISQGTDISSSESKLSDEMKTKNEPVASTSMQGLTVDKKRMDVTLSKSDIKQDIKTLDFTPILPHALPVPAPISTRLPATSSIEEKLSAAAVFRSKIKDAKKEEETDITPRKPLKETLKKLEVLPVKKKEKEEIKPKYEVEKKRSEPNIVKKDPLHEIEIRKDPLLEVIKKKDDDVLKSGMSSSIPIVTKTYGGQKKVEPKIEESWKKASKVASPAHSEEPTSNDYSSIRKETIVSKIKSSLERDSIDSTDSSDSERRLTIIDSEDFADDKNESSSDAKVMKTVSGIQKEQNEIGGAMAQAKKMEEENLNSLLCEEEIPGSPTPGVENMDHDHRNTGPPNITKTDIASKAAVAFVAAQMPLSTIASSSQMQSTAISTLSSMSTLPQNTNLVTVAITVQHASTPPVRALQPQQQLVQPPQPQAIPQQQPAAPQRRESNEAAPVMDNTPPTTPDSTISNLSNSPRDERTGGSTPSSSEDNSKPNSSEKASSSGDDASSSVINSENGETLKPPVKRIGLENNETAPSPKKRKKRKDQENLPQNASGKKSPRQSTRNSRQAGSDSDDTSEGSNQCSNAHTAASANSNVAPVNGINGNDLGSFANNSLRKYNFLTEIDPALDGNQRINVLMQRMTDLRKTYISIKTELAVVERRRKKIKRRKREAQKAAKAEMQQACS